MSSLSVFLRPTCPPRRAGRVPTVLRRKPTVDLMFPNPKRRGTSIRCSASEAAGDSNGSEAPNEFQVQSDSSGGGLWEKWKMKTGGDEREAAKLGLSAVLAYGLFDAVTYTTFFVLTFLGYEKSTGKNPAANLQALLGIVILMWSGNNVTRPFRVAGAAALAPFIDKGLKKIQKFFNLPSLAFAFGLVVSVVAVLCLSIVGLLILSRWGR